jgi:anti-sigma-K factor RskA
MSEPRDGYDDILGAYALDAVDDVERARIERHLAVCEGCSNEVRRLQRASAELATLSGPAVPLPDDFADRVDRVIGRSAPARRGIRRHLAVTLAAAAAVVAIAGGYFLSTNTSRQLSNLVATGRAVPLQAAGGFSGRGTVYVGRNAVAIVLRNIPDQGRSHSYELWAIRSGSPSSLGVFDRHGTVKTVVHTSSPATYAVTVEPAGGSDRPTTSPVLESG